MPTVATYRCPKCGTEYRPLDAGARRFICCGVPLERVGLRRNNTPAPQRNERLASTFASAPMTPSQRSTELVEVIPPRENLVDALAVGTMLNTFSMGSLFSLEIASDHQSRRFLVRGTPEGVAHIRRQLQATYDQVSFRNLSAEEDPGRPSNLPTACAQLTLARPAYLPVRSYEDGDFEKADPVKGLLAAFDGLQTEERALTQVILTPAPPQWSRRYEGSARQVEKSMMGEAMSLGLVARQFASVITVMTAVAFGLWAILSFIQKAWLTFFVAGILFALAVIGVMWLYSFINEQANVDPKLVQTKIATPALDANIRLYVVGKTPERAHQKLREIVAAYRRLNLQSGNAFVAQAVEFDPRAISVERVSWWNEWMARVTRLNTNELASLWHLPFGAEFPGVERTLAKRLLPLPAKVEKGILVGHSTHQGQRIPVHIDERALWHHIFMVAKTQKGKSTLMAHLATEAMRRECAVVVVDPHGDLARSLLGLVPRARASDVLYIDFSDPHQVVGLNVLDMSQGRKADQIVSNLVHVGELIWSDNWGPRMEDAFRMALRTLLAANTILARRNEPQFTLLDIPPLFGLPNFRHRVIQQYVSDQDTIEWWSGYFERLYESLRMDVINPVLTKIHRFSTHETVRNIIGQATSTVNFRELLKERRILLVNTATGVIGPDAGGLLGAVLVDCINFAVRDQMAIPDPTARDRVVMVVDEFQSIPGVDYKNLLAELQKMGASFILATQALGQLDEISLGLRKSILSNNGALFVFQTSAEDADLLRHELDEAVTATDVINLDSYACYLKTQLGNQRLPVMHLDTEPPAQGQRATVEIITSQMTRYTRSLAVAESGRHSFQEQWYGRERNLLRQLMMQGRTSSKKSDKDSGQTESGKGASTGNASNQSASTSIEETPDSDSPKSAIANPDPPDPIETRDDEINPGESNPVSTNINPATPASLAPNATGSRSSAINPLAPSATVQNPSASNRIASSGMDLNLSATNAIPSGANDQNPSVTHPVSSSIATQNHVAPEPAPTDSESHEPHPVQPDDSANDSPKDKDASEQRGANP